MICDEPVSALDVSIQAQVLNLLADPRDDLRVFYLFISHDLAAVEFLADRVAAMYLGSIVEVATRASLFARPRHPYTRALLAAVPNIRKRKGQIEPPVPGEVPSACAPLHGCPFQSRCRLAAERCRTETPSLSSLGQDHQVACFNPC